MSIDGSGVGGQTDLPQSSSNDCAPFWRHKQCSLHIGRELCGVAEGANGRYEAPSVVDKKDRRLVRGKELR